MEYAFFNDDFVPSSTACIHISDLSIQRSYAAFDFFRLTGNKPLFIDDHLERFYHSSSRLRLQPAFSPDELKEIIEELIQKNNQPESGIKITITGGYSSDGITVGKPNLLISQHTFQPPTEEQMNDGISLITHEHQRQLPDVKTTDYLMAIWLKPKLVESKADELLYVQDGAVSESPRSNFFVVMNNDTIVTPSKNMLKGITRNHVIQLAKDHYKVEERSLQYEELKHAREAFITSTTKRILPVRQVDDFVFPDRNITKQLSQLFEKHAANSVGMTVIS